jgi:hypothetical protein
MNKIRALYELLYIAIQMIYALFIAVPLAIILFILTWAFDKIKKTVKKMFFIYHFFMYKIFKK